MDLLKAFVSGIISAIGKPLSFLATYLVGMSRGREQQQNAQNEQDMDALKRASDASNAVTDDDDSVQRDPYNRDNH